LCGLLGVGAVRADLVAYNFFGADIPAGGVGTAGHVTRVGLSDRLILPAPLYFEDFESGHETLVSSVAGWSETNRTDRLTPGLDPNDPRSDTYLGWALISSARLGAVFGSRRLQVAPGQELNHQPVTLLMSNRLVYAESDRRSGNQLQVLFSPPYDLAGHEGVVLVLDSAYEQNQDSIAGVEYSKDGGATWLPVVYWLDDQGGAADIIRTNGVIDVRATLGTARTDQAFGLAYSNFLGAPVSESLRPHLVGRTNDDSVEAKRVEIFRLPGADREPDVRFRFFQAGTSSWYWGVDNWGLYSVPEIEVASGRLTRYGDGTDTGITVTLTVHGRPLSATRPQPVVPPGPPPGSAAAEAFPLDLGAAGSTSLYAGQTHAIEFTGLDPQKVYEIVLYSDLGFGDGATGHMLRCTLSGAPSFANASGVAPPWSVISGAQRETVTIDVSDNGRAGRGYVCRFTEVRSGNDGAVRLSLASPQGACLNALKLVETQPPRIWLAEVSALTDQSATVHGVQALEAPAPVNLCYGLAPGGQSTNAWERVVFLGILPPGPFTAELAGLDTFKKYYVAVCSAGSGEEAWSAVRWFRPQQQGLLYATGFEPGEAHPYALGALAGQGPPALWQVLEGSAVVQQARTAHGLQAVQAGDGTLDVSLPVAEPVLWVDAFFLETGLANPPVVPTNRASGVIYFSATDGILALDGNGGGGGRFVSVAPSFPTNVFVRVTTRNDYVNRRYDVWVDGVLSRAGLGFKDDAVTTFSGARRRSAATSYLDDFSVSRWGLDADSDGDGVVDLDEAKFYGSYPLLADSDGDGAGDGLEIRAGTDPADAASVFALDWVRDAQQNVRIRVPTLTGRQYTLQRRREAGAGPWENVADATAIPGDGTVREFLQTPDGWDYFYRGVIVNR